MASRKPEAVDRYNDTREELVKHLRYLHDKFCTAKYELNNAEMVEKVQQAIDDTEAKLAEYPEVMTIERIAEVYGREYSDDMIKLLVANLARSMKVGRGLDEEDYEEVAELIFEKYSKQLSLEHLAICFNLVKLGEYGTTYDRMDCATILGFIKRFVDDNRERSFRLYESRCLALKNSREPGESSAQENDGKNREAMAAVDIWRARAESKK